MPSNIDHNTPLGIATEGILQHNDPIAVATQGIAQSKKKYTYIAKFNDLIFGGSSSESTKKIYGQIDGVLDLSGSAQVVFKSKSAKKDRTGVAVFKKKPQKHTYVWNVPSVKEDAVCFRGESDVEFIKGNKYHIITTLPTPEKPIDTPFIEIEVSVVEEPPRNNYSYVSELPCEENSRTSPSMPSMVRYVNRRIKDEDALLSMLLMDDSAPIVTSSMYSRNYTKIRKDDRELLDILDVI